MKEPSNGKVPFPSAHPAINYQVDSDNNNLGESNMIKEGYQQPITFRRVSQSCQVEIKIEYLYPIPYTYNLVLNGA